MLVRYERENKMMKVEREEALSLIGAAGANINRLKEETEANIDVDIDKGIIRIQGEDDKAAKAFTRIREELGLDLPVRLVVHSFVVCTMRCFQKAELPVPEDAAGTLLGKGGKNLVRLGNELGVRLSVSFTSVYDGISPLILGFPVCPTPQSASYPC